MAYKLQVSDTAESNIDDILTYMVDKLKSSGTAKTFLDDIGKTYKALKENPYIFSLCKNDVLARQEYRTAVIKNYLIFYQIDENTKTVKIISVMYGGRDYASIL